LLLATFKCCNFYFTEWVWCLGDFFAKQCGWFTTNSSWFSGQGNFFPKQFDGSR